MTEPLEHKADLLGMLPEELELFVRGLGQPAYRARQLFSWLHRGATFEEMTDLPRPVRERLQELARTGSLEMTQRRRAPDGTRKYAFRTPDGHTLESVFIPHADHTTVCVSSQIGCAYGCAFCATGQGGLVRSLAAGEIVEQVVWIQHAVAPARVRNVVFMGMGEPLANYDAVLRGRAAPQSSARTAYRRATYLHFDLRPPPADTAPGRRRPPSQPGRLAPRGDR